MGGVPSKVVKFTWSNRVMTVSELRNLVYQKTLAGSSKRSQSAHTMTQVEKFGLLRDCFDGEVRVLLHDHFQARIDRNWEQYEAVEAENLQLETQMRAAWQRAYDAYTAELAAKEQAQAQAAQPAAPAPAPGAGAAGAPPPAPPAPAGAAAQVALPPLQLPVHHAAPKKPPPDDPTIMTDAYALLERTFSKVTPEVHKRYLYFKRTAGQTTIMTLHELRELCRLTKNPTEGRAVVEKAINALSDQLRKVLEAEVLQWSGSQLTLDYLEGRARAIDEALQTRELERAPLELAKAAAAKGVGQLHLKEEGKAQDSGAGSSKRPVRSVVGGTGATRERRPLRSPPPPPTASPGSRASATPAARRGMSRLTAPRNQKTGRLRGESRGRFATSATNGIPTRRMSVGKSIQRRSPRSGERRKGAVPSRRMPQAQSQVPQRQSRSGCPIWRGAPWSNREAVHWMPSPSTPRTGRSCAPPPWSSGTRRPRPGQRGRPSGRQPAPRRRRAVWAARLPASSPRGRGRRPLQRRLVILAPLGVNDRPLMQPQPPPPGQPVFPRGLGSTAPTTPGIRASRMLSRWESLWSCWTRPGRGRSPET
jgi:hypothetical protein